MMKKITYTTILTFGFLLVSGCDMPWDPGPLPTEIIASDFVPGHNIFAVMRADGQAGSSFIHVERFWQTPEYDDSLDVLIRNALVLVSDASQTWAFTFVDDTSVGSNYYCSDFIAQPSIEYTLLVASPNLPAASGTVVVPPSLYLDTNSVVVSSKSVMITLPADPIVKLYDVYLYSPIGSVSQRILGSIAEQSVEIDFRGIGAPTLMVIYGYENNLATYMTLPTTIKPQTYRELESSVEEGYGCLGAVIVEQVDLTD